MQTSSTLLQTNLTISVDILRTQFHEFNINNPLVLFIYALLMFSNSLKIITIDGNTLEI